MASCVNDKPCKTVIHKDCHTEHKKKEFKHPLDISTWYFGDVLEMLGKWKNRAAIF